MSYLIKDTTKQERIELIRSWVPDDEVMDGCDIDLWEMYRDYIDGKREIAEINASFNAGFYEESGWGERRTSIIDEVYNMVCGRK